MLDDARRQNGIAFASLDYRLVATKYYYEDTGGAEQEEEFIDVDADGEMSLNAKHTMSQYQVLTGRLEYGAKCVYSAVEAFEHILANTGTSGIDANKVGFSANSAGGMEVSCSAAHPLHHATPHPRVKRRAY